MIEKTAVLPLTAMLFLGTAQASDTINVKDAPYNAKLDGSQDDTAAFNAARAANTLNAVVVVPKGCINANVPVDTTRTVLWQMFGDTYCNSGGYPVYGLGSDIVETFLPNNGGKYFSRGISTPNSGPIVTVRQDVTHSNTNGAPGVLATLNTETYVTGSPPAFVFANLNKLFDSSTFTSGNNVAIYNQYTRNAGGKSPGWAITNEARDSTGLPSSQTAALIGEETDVFGNGLDDANRRVAIDAVVGRHDLGAGKIMESAYGVRVSSAHNDTPNSWFKYGFAALSGISVAAYDASQAVYRGVPIAYRVGGNNYVDLSSDGSRLLRWNSGGAFQYTVNGTLLFEILDSGRATLYGGVNTTEVNASSVTGPNATTGVLVASFKRSSDPTAGDIPDGRCTDWNNTAANTFKHVCNFGGTLRSVTLN